jgi:ATP-binding cassette, subfamily B, bacterial
MIETLRGCWDLLRMSWRQHRLKLTAAVLLKLGDAVALPLTAPAMAVLTDAAVDRDAGRAAAAAVVAALFTIASFTMGHFAHVLYFELGEINVLTKELELIELANGSAGIEHHERPEYADRVQVLRQELQRAGWSSMEALLSGMGVAAAIVITGVLLARLNPLLLLLPLAALPPLLLGRRAEAVLGDARRATAGPARRAWHLFGLTVDAGSAKELRVAGLGDEIRSRHAALWQGTTSTLWRAELRAAVLRVAGQAVFAVVYAGATLLVVADAVRGRHTVGDVVLVIALAVLVNQQVSTAVGLLHDLQRVARALADLRWLRGLVARSAPTTRPDAAAPDRIRGGIRLAGVGFTYPGTSRAVLRDVDLTLPAGSTVALVGENGAGKTTLVKLLCRLYEPTAGQITLDGVDIRRFPLDAWRRTVSAAFQDHVRFELLARQTVGVGDLPNVDSTVAVTAALERARAADLVRALPHGLDTQLGKTYADGAELSGGQWQKLALGRAMMRPGPLLLILDEPTAALDAQAEHELFARYAANARRVAARTGGVTVLVSHRFSTVRMADLILVVADGRIVEAGEHERLMANGGLYAELYAMQAAAYR